MLLRNERHTAADLEKWQDYEELDSFYVNDSLSRKEDIAVSVIAGFIKSHKCYLGVSWGKDSTVVLDLIARNNLTVPVVHLRCIPSHNFYCDAVRDSFLRIYPEVDYHEVICNYANIYSSGLPDHLQDKETDKIWNRTWRQVSKRYGACHLSGVRSEESNVRAFRFKKFGISSKNTCAPIGYWTNQDIFSYLYKYRLPVHPNYGMLGGGRWKREYIRVAEIGDIHGNGVGRTQWEKEYYQDVLNRNMVYK